MTSSDRSFVRPEHGSMITTLKELERLDVIPGLDELEVRTRRERGEGNNIKLKTSRSTLDILRQNVFTLINIVLFALGATMVAIGRPGEAVASVSLIFLNITIGVIQEIRAKRKLDQIALLTRPQVSVMREGEERNLDPGELVRGDIIVVRPGDQIVVDGIVVGDGKIEVDESLLTGESDPIPKEKGDSLLSGSFCVTGQTLYVARRVGARSFANKLAAEARTFRVVRTPLQRDIIFVIRFLMLVAIFFGILLAISAAISDIRFMRGVQVATVIAGLVPNGLFFMVIVAYAMGALRITQRGALIQQSNSVESLSNVNVLCMDKTGTLTANQIKYHAVHPIDCGEEELKGYLGDFARSVSASNKTSDAIREALPGKQRQVVDEVPFSSKRKWSALSFASPYLQGSYVLGAYEMLRPYLPDDVDLSDQIEAWSAQGLRVLLFAYNANETSLHRAGDEPHLPPLLPLGLISFTDVLRPEARETLAGFAQTGVNLKVISGDNPQTVAALAIQAGLADDLKAVSGPELAEMDDAMFEQVADEATVFGRITPAQKEKLVDVLCKRGYYVAMIGDGVNDVLSLKKANLGISMQSGSSATRSVADMVLLNDSFGALPPAFLEGQRITSGMRDILRLYLARAIAVVLIIIGAALVGVSFPFIPKHVSVIALFSTGIPPFALAVWARPEASRRGLLSSVMHFAAPAGITLAIAGLLIYVYAFDSVVNRGRTIDVVQSDIDDFRTYAGIDYEIYTEDEFKFEVATLFAQSMLTVFSVFAGLVLVLFVEPPVHWLVAGDKFSGDWRPTILAVGLGGLFALLMQIPGVRRFYEILPLAWMDWAVIGGTVLIWSMVLRYGWRLRLFERFLNLDDMILFEDSWLMEERARVPGWLPWSRAEAEEPAAGRDSLTPPGV